MANVEMIATLFAVSVRYHRSFGGNGDALSRSELAGLLAGLDKPAMDFALAKYGVDVDSERRLIAHVRVWLADYAIREDWKIVKGRPTMCNMAALAVFEVVRPNRCERCHGRGVLVNRVCGRCGSSGYVHLSGREIAGAIGVNECNYRRTWCGRYERVLNYVQEIDSKVVISLRHADKRDDYLAV